MAEHQLLNNINLQGSINASAPALSEMSQNSLSDGSWNSIVSGTGFSRGFGGMTSLGVNTGSRKMLPFGKVPGGIRDIGLVKGSGSFFEDIGRSRWGIGSGQPMIEGVDVAGFVLSTILQVQVAEAGVFGTPFQAGLSQPSAPEIGIINTLGDVSNSVTAKIERRRKSTGARSLSSPTSAVIQPVANRVRLTFPLASSGQTHWRAYFTFQGFGGTGIHYLALYAGESDIPESVVAAGSVDGIARSLEFNYKDGDLIPVEASYDDYAPPAATHALRLENVLNLAGCYSDDDVSSTNAGTAIAVSKVNNYESYVPTHLLFLPEQVTDTLARPVDDYGYVACENSIHAIQYVGSRGDELPPCTITTILPDIGVSYPHNWTHFRGRLLIYSAEGNLILMDESGGFDTSFAGAITKIIKNWSPANTIVGYDPKNDLIVIANGKRILAYSLASGVWRQIWLPDFGISGDVLSCTTSRRRLYVSVTNAQAETAYSFDTANNVAPVSVCSNYQNSGTSNLKDIYEMTAQAETSQTAYFAICVGKNLNKAVFRRISVTNNSNAITDAENGFYAAMTGKKVIIFAPAIAGLGTSFIIGRISGFDRLGGTTAFITDMAGAALASKITKGELLMFVGDYAAARSIDAKSRHFRNFFPNIVEARSYAVSCWISSGTETGNVLGVEIMGSVYKSDRAF